MRTQNESEHVMTNPNPCLQKHEISHTFDKHIPCLRGHKMLLNTCWPITAHAIEYTKWILTYVDQTYPMTSRTQHASQQGFTKTFHASKDKKCILTWNYQTDPITPRTLVLTKSLPFQWRDKMYLNLCWLNSSHSSEERNGISTWVDQTFLMPTRTQNASQLVWTKPI